MRVEQRMPWEWKDGGKVTVDLNGAKEFTLLPVEPGRVQRFRTQLALARQITVTLVEGKRAFETGKAEYTNATKRLKKLLSELGQALTEQLAAASEVGKFFVPGGIELEFGDAVELLTDFSAETIERLMEAAVKKAEPAKEMPPPAPEATAVPGDGQVLEPAVAAPVQ